MHILFLKHGNLKGCFDHWFVLTMDFAKLIYSLTDLWLLILSKKYLNAKDFEENKYKDFVINLNVMKENWHGSFDC